MANSGSGSGSSSGGELYTTIKNEASSEYEEKRSVFIGHARPVKTEEEATEYIRSIKAKYHDARHNVSAFLLAGGCARCSDDGEPQGSAGIPVLGCIKNAGVVDACVVVTRYFGGILLGTGGLARAYAKAAAAAIEAAGIVVYEAYAEMRLRCQYSDYQRVLFELSGAGAVLDGTDFSEFVTVRFAVKKKIAGAVTEKLTGICEGRSRPELTGERYGLR
jgi:uncharacterized YigZ family protein